MMLFWNFSNPKAADYVISSTLASMNGTAVDGVMSDDSAPGFPEHGYVPSDLGLTPAAVAAYNADKNATYVKMVDVLTAANKTNWQSLSLGRVRCLCWHPSHSA